jgi:hypothetical protein
VNVGVRSGIGVDQVQDLLFDAPGQVRRDRFVVVAGVRVVRVGQRADVALELPNRRIVGPGRPVT